MKLKVGSRVKCVGCGAGTDVPPEHLQFRKGDGLLCLDCYRKWARGKLAETRREK